MIDTIRPTQQQLDLINKFNACVKTAAELIAEVPTSREASLAYTKLEESSMWLAQAVLRNMAQETPESDRPAIVVQ